MTVRDAEERAEKSKMISYTYTEMMNVPLSILAFTVHMNQKQAGNIKLMCVLNIGTCLCSNT